MAPGRDSPKVNSPPEIFMLAKGWIQLNIGFHEEVEVIEKHVWSIDSTLIAINFWSSLFDASRERLDMVSI